MNLAALRTAVANEGYATNAAVIDDAINATYREVCGQERWKFLEKVNTSGTTTAGTVAYAPNPTDWRNFDSVRLSDSLGNFYNLDYMGEQAFEDASFPSGTNTDVPRYWTYSAGLLRFYPTPDATYTISLKYIFNPPDLSADGDVPVLPVVYHDILRWGAVEYFAFRQRDYLSKQYAGQMKDGLVAKMKGEYQVKQRQTGSHVTRTGRYSGHGDEWGYAIGGWGY